MLLDTSAWVEFFKGTESGKKVAKILETFPVVYTCPLSIAEVSAWSNKNNEDAEKYLVIIKRFSRMLEISEDTLALSGKLYAGFRKTNNKISLIGCIIYTTARIHGLSFATKDRDFSGFEGVEFISDR